MVENDNFFGSFDLGDGDVSYFLFDTESCLVLFVLVWTSLNLFGPVQFWVYGTFLFAGFQLHSWCEQLYVKILWYDKYDDFLLNTGALKT